MITSRTDVLAGWQVTVRKTIARPPQDIFALLTDVERMAGLGPEHHLARWLTEFREEGARFQGFNRIGVFKWAVVCKVTVFERPRRFGWTVGDPREPSSTWTYTLETTNGGAGDATTVTQTFEHGPGPSFVRRAVELAPAAADNIITARTHQLRRNMSATLQQVELQLMGTDTT